MFLSVLFVSTGGTRGDTTLLVEPKAFLRVQKLNLGFFL